MPWHLLTASVSEPDLRFQPLSRATRGTRVRLADARGEEAQQVPTLRRLGRLGGSAGRSEWRLDPDALPDCRDLGAAAGGEGDAVALADGGSGGTLLAGRVRPAGAGG